MTKLTKFPETKRVQYLLAKGMVIAFFRRLFTHRNIKTRFRTEIVLL